MVLWKQVGEGNERNLGSPSRRSAFLGRVLACLVHGSTPSSEKRTQHKIGTQWICVEWVDGGSTFSYSTWRVFVEEGQGEESWEGPRSDTDLSHALCISLYQAPVLEENLGQNQSAEKDKHPRATDWASGLGFSWTSDNIYAALSSKEWAQDGENKDQVPWVHMERNMCTGWSGHKCRHMYVQASPVVVHGDKSSGVPRDCGLPWGS